MSVLLLVQTAIHSPSSPVSLTMDPYQLDQQNQLHHRGPYQTSIRKTGQSQQEAEQPLVGKEHFVLLCKSENDNNKKKKNCPKMMLAAPFPTISIRLVSIMTVATELLTLKFLTEV